MSEPDGMSTRSVMLLVAGREVRERLRAPSYWVLTALLVVVILAAGVVGRIAASSGPDELSVAVVGDAPAGFARALESVAREAGDLDVEVTDVPTARQARAELRDGDVDVVVVAPRRRVLFQETVDQVALVTIREAWAATELRDRLGSAGVPPAELESALSARPLTSGTVEGDEEDTALAIATGTIAAVLLFMSLQMFGGYVLTGVVEEKSTAVVEVLLVRMGADQLLAGKVLGIGVAAMIQFGMAIAAGVVALFISGVDVPPSIWSTLPVTFLWFLGGYALYSTLFALAGSLVSRQEDAQAASAPIISVLVLAYVVVFMFGYAPESTASVILSILPPTAPFLMPMRVAAGAASLVEVLLAAVLMVVAILGTWKLTGRIYEQVLLRRGSRIGWSDALALARRPQL